MDCGSAFPIPSGNINAWTRAHTCTHKHARVHMYTHGALEHQLTSEVRHSGGLAALIAWFDPTTAIEMTSKQCKVEL